MKRRLVAVTLKLVLIGIVSVALYYFAKLFLPLFGVVLDAERLNLVKSLIIVVAGSIAINIAREVGIPYQLEVLYGGTTDAMAIAFRREGVSAVALSIPTRYVHSPVELLDVRDAVNAAALLRHVIEKMPPFSSRPDEGGSRAREARRPPGPGHRPVGASGPLLGWRDDGWRSGAGPLGPAGARLPEERCAFLYDDLFL